MIRTLYILLSLLFVATTTSHAKGFGVAQSGETPKIFPGKHSLKALVSNSSDHPVDVNLRTRLYQASSTTLMPVSKIDPWKRVRVLSGQTIVENVEITFPDVRSETVFEIRFLDEAEKVIGQIFAEVFPTNLLQRLPKGEPAEAIAVIDPENVMKPLLKAHGVSFEDVDADSGLDGFEGKVVLVGPFSEKSSVPENLRKRLIEQSKRSLAVVWMQPPANERKNLPSIYIVREGSSVFAIVDAESTKNLKASPQGQANLIQAVRLALHPESLRLPKGSEP